MAFRSPLLAVQRLRSNLERLAWLRLGTVHAQIAAAGIRLRSLQEEIAGVRTTTAKRLIEGTASEQLRIDSVGALEFERSRAIRTLDQLAQQRRSAEEDFLRYRRERQIVQNAIALEKATYEEERSRREQSVLDDAILQRITRERQSLDDDEV